MTASRLGDTVGVSESTVVRFATEVGFEGTGKNQGVSGRKCKIFLPSLQNIPSPSPLYTGPPFVVHIGGDLQLDPPPQNAGQGQGKDPQDALGQHQHVVPLLGVVWEIYEFTADGILHTNMQKFGLEDGTPFLGRLADSTAR